MSSYAFSQLFTQVHLESLRSIARLSMSEPVTALDDPVLGSVDLLLTGWGCPPIDEVALADAPKLRAIVHAAGSIKHHVTEACWNRGIHVSSAADANAIPVAEFTLAAILFANKRVFGMQRLYAESRAWKNWPEEFPGLGNYKKVVGVVGASRVGRRVIDLLQGFDIDVLVHDPFANEVEGASLVGLDELMGGSDVVTLHAPQLTATRHMIDRRRLGLMREGATLINTARGSLVDHEALSEKLVSGAIFAVLDTTDPEPLPADSVLYDLPNVFLTPHVAGAMGAEAHRLTELAIGEVERFARGDAFLYEVRRDDLERIA